MVQSTPVFVVFNTTTSTFVFSLLKLKRPIKSWSQGKCSQKILLNMKKSSKLVATPAFPVSNGISVMSVGIQCSEIMMESCDTLH